MKTYKIIGLEPWSTNDGTQMQRLFCVTHQEGVVGLATLAASIPAANLPSDISLDSVVVLGFNRQGKYLEFVMRAPELPNSNPNNL